MTVEKKSPLSETLIMSIALKLINLESKEEVKAHMEAVFAVVAILRPNMATTICLTELN